MWPVVFFLLFRSALMQDQWRLVDQDGHVETVWGTPRLKAEERAHLTSAWVWSGVRPPRRIEPKDVGEQKPPGNPARLDVRVVRGSRTRPPSEIEIVAAPLAMWREVPEHLLPHWPVPANGRLAVPRAPGERWRARVVGPGEGSWWVDVQPGRSAAELTAVTAKGARLRVIDERGAPVAPVNGSTLEGAARQGANGLWATLRGESGALELPGLPDLGEITVTVVKPGYVPASASGRPSELPDRLRLSRGAALSGRIAAEGGGPVADAVIEVEAWSSPRVSQLYRMSARSGADGAWVLAGVPPGPVFLSARAPGFALFVQQMEIPPGETDLGVFTLPAGFDLSVTVVDEQGSPVPAARIDAGAKISAESDGRGMAKLSGVSRTAPLRLTATAAGHLPGKSQVNPPLPDPVRIELRRSFRVLGRFLEAPGVPAAGGLIQTAQASCTREGRLDERGGFELDVPPGEMVTVALRSPRTRELRLNLPAGVAGEVRDLGDLMPPAGLAVTGRVQRAADGSPVPGARVWLPRPGAGGELFAWASRDVLETATEEDGRFRLAGLTPGPAVLRVDAPGFARASVGLAFERDGSPETTPADAGDISLVGGAALHVLVPAEATLAEPAEARADLRGNWIEPDMLTAPVRDGEAIIHNVPPGPVLVTVLAGRKLLCERQATVPADTAQLEVDCRGSSLTVAGRVRVGGALSGPGLLLWQPPATAAASRIDTVVSPGGLRQQTILGAGRPQVDVAVGADGGFVSQELTPGRWQVSWVPAAGVVSGAQAVEIPAVERFEAEISYPGLAVTGQVLDEEGHPAERARVRELTTGALAFAAADGTFALTGLAGPKAVLQARLDDLSSAVRELALSPDRAPEPVVLTLSKRSADRIEVGVADATGFPASGAFVFLDEEGKGVRLLTTAADGKAAASFEPPL